jgi:hypothetical protein
VNADVEEGIVPLDNGEEIKSDLGLAGQSHPLPLHRADWIHIIAADGLKSIVRLLVVGDEAFNTS